MKHTKRILALLTAILLILPLAGCLVPNESESATEAAPSGVVPAPNGANSGNASDAAAFDADAIAIELGNIKITAGELESLFDQYVSMFSYGYGIDEESLNEFLRMAEEGLVEYYLPLWKAEQLGIALPEEEEATIAAESEQSVAEERNEILCMFAEEYTDVEEAIENAETLTSEQLSIVLDAIDAELAEMFGEGYTFDDYLAMRYDDYVLSARLERLSELLMEKAGSDSVPDQEAVDQWYETTLEDQKTRYDASPEEFFYDAQSGLNEFLFLYAPKGYARVQVVSFIPDGEPDEKIDENAELMERLEAEYGALVLNGGDPDRKAEIEAEYAALKAEKDVLESKHFGDAIRQSAEAYDALAGGLSFEDAMERYNAAVEDDSHADERLVYLEGVDTHDEAIAEIAKTLAPGEYSKPVLADGAYVIVKLVELIPEGVVERAAIESEIRAAAEKTFRDNAWEALFDAWLEEAKESAVYHRETYESLTDLYVNP